MTQIQNEQIIDDNVAPLPAPEDELVFNPLDGVFDVPESKPQVNARIARISGNLGDQLRIAAGINQRPQG
jgi:hypothetical protein